MTRTTVLWTAALILVALAAITGCGPKGPTPGGAGETAAPRITFWHAQTSDVTRKVIEDAVGRFEDTGEASVRISVFKNDAYKQKLAQAMAAGEMPDVFHTWGGGLLAEYVQRRQVADLTAQAAADNITQRILPAALKFGTVNGRVYAIPMDVSDVVMWYNPDLFAKAGVTPPKTWDEFLAACAKLRAAGITPIALGNKDRWPGAFYFVYLAARIGGTKPFEDAAARAPGGTFQHPSFVEAGRRLQELVKADVFSHGMDALSADDARDLFIRGKAAMILMGTWFLADLKSDMAATGTAGTVRDSGTVPKVDCFAFPSVPGGPAEAQKIVVGGINSAYAMSASCTRTGAALGLIKELTGDITETRWGETGRIPALRQDLSEGMISPSTLRAAGILFDAPEIQLYYDQALPAALAEVHKSTTQSLFALAITPEEAARQMERAASR